MGGPFFKKSINQEALDHNLVGSYVRDFTVMRIRRTGGSQYTSADEPEQWKYLSALQSNPQIFVLVSSIFHVSGPSISRATPK